MPSKTLVLRVEMDASTQEVVGRFAKETAKWEQGVFGRWYADFRAHRRDLSKSIYAGLVSTKTISAKAVGRKGGRQKFRVNVQGRGRNLYNAFITKGKRIEPAVPTIVRSSHLLGPLSHLGTTMEGFLDIELRRHRAHERRVLNRRKEARARSYGKTRKLWRPHDFYPRFKPIARFQHGVVRWTEDGFSVSHPFDANGQRLTIRLAWSHDSRYEERLWPLALHLAGGGKVGVEVKRHEEGERAEGWYAHIAVPVPEPEPRDEIARVMGVDVGERNPATLVVLRGPGADGDRVGAPKMYSGISTRDALERQVCRTRRLRSAADLGSRGAASALARAKGKQSRTLTTLSQQVSHDVVREAVASDVDAIAMEDLSKFTPGEKVRRAKMPFRGKRAKRLRRLLSRWNRGQVQQDIRYKAVSEGIRIAGPQGSGIFARGTSSTCPRCGKWDPAARDRSVHLFACRQPCCGFSGNDDLVGASNIAARGWSYFHSPKGRKGGAILPAGLAPGLANPPQEPDCVSTGGDSIGLSGLVEGAASRPQAMMGGLVGPPSQSPEKTENGTGCAVAQANHLSPTIGEGTWNRQTTANGGTTSSDGQDSATNRAERGATSRSDKDKTASPASAGVVTPSRGPARKPVSRRGRPEEPRRNQPKKARRRGGARK